MPEDDALKILVYEGKIFYCKTVCKAIASSLTQFMLGAVNIVVLGYSFMKKDSHAILCTAGFHFFCAEGIMSLKSHSWSAPLFLRHRRIAHITLQVCCLIFNIAGAIKILSSKGLTGLAHGSTGVAALSVTIAAVLLGPFAFLFGESVMTTIHITVAMTAFILSSINLILGLLMPSFKQWAGLTVTYTLISFVVFYTLFIFITVTIKWIRRIRNLF